MAMRMSRGMVSELRVTDTRRCPRPGTSAGFLLHGRGHSARATRRTFAVDESIPLGLGEGGGALGGSRGLGSCSRGSATNEAILGLDGSINAASEEVARARGGAEAAAHPVARKSPDADETDATQATKSKKKV